MAYLRGRYNGGAFTKTVIDATMCVLSLDHRDLLDFAGLSSNLAYITSVFIGYIGTDSIGSLIKRFAAKKGQVEVVKSIINVRRSSICWRGRRELITDVQRKTRNHGYDVIVGGELFTDYSDHPRKLVTPKPKQISNARTLPASFPLVGCLPQLIGLKDFSPKKSGRWHCSRLRSVALYLIDRGDIRQAIDRCSNIWASLPGAGYGQFEHKADSLIANSKKRAERSERLMYEQSHRDYLRSPVICIIVCLC